MNRPLRSEDAKGRGRSWSPQESRSRRSRPSRRRWTNRRWQPMTSFMSVGWGPSRPVTRQAGGPQARTSEYVQGVGWAAAEAGPAESPGDRTRPAATPAPDGWPPPGAPRGHRSRLTGRLPLHACLLALTKAQPPEHPAISYSLGGHARTLVMSRRSRRLFGGVDVARRRARTARPPPFVVGLMVAGGGTGGPQTRPCPWALAGAGGTTIVSLGGRLGKAHRVRPQCPTARSTPSSTMTSPTVTSTLTSG
jgi:hypothetical protein